LQAINLLGGGIDYRRLEEHGYTIVRRDGMGTTGLKCDNKNNIIYWGIDTTWYSAKGAPAPLYFTMRDFDVTTLAHELQHAEDDIDGANMRIKRHRDYSDKNAARTGNVVAAAIIGMMPKAYGIDSGHSAWDYFLPGGFSPYQPAPEPPWGSTR
jgi:hypothetical protein